MNKETLKVLTEEITNNETDKEILSNFKVYCEAIKNKGLCEEASKINKDYEY